VSCSSPQTISGLASGTSYIVRMRITCTSTGGYSSYSNATTMSTSTSYPAYGTYLSSYCSGCTLYYRYANGSGGSYDVSQGCSTSCGGCCCATASGTFLYEQCSGCDLYYYYADGCYGTTATLVESNAPACGCGDPGGCTGFFSNGSGYYYYYDCDGVFNQGEIYEYGVYMGCVDQFQDSTGGYFETSRFCDAR
jgi:hypothetical protein